MVYVAEYLIKNAALDNDWNPTITIYSERFLLQAYHVYFFYSTWGYKDTGIILGCALLMSEGITLQRLLFLDEPIAHTQNDSNYTLHTTKLLGGILVSLCPSARPSVPNPVSAL